MCCRTLCHTLPGQFLSNDSHYACRYSSQNHHVPLQLRALLQVLLLSQQLPLQPFQLKQAPEHLRLVVC